MPLGKPRKRLPHRKIGVTSKTPVGVISVVTLIRTDTTLDHSQKAEKVWAATLREEVKAAQLFTPVFLHSATRAQIAPQLSGTILN